MIEKLTPREWEVAVLSSHGLSHREVAKRLGVKEKSAATYREGAMGKLGVKNVVLLTRKMVERELADKKRFAMDAVVVADAAEIEHKNCIREPLGCRVCRALKIWRETRIGKRVGNVAQGTEG